MKWDAGALNMKTDDGTPAAPAVASLSCYSCADNALDLFKSNGEHEHKNAHTHTHTAVWISFCWTLLAVVFPFRAIGILHTARVHVVQCMILPCAQPM